MKSIEQISAEISKREMPNVIFGIQHINFEEIGKKIAKQAIIEVLKFIPVEECPPKPHEKILVIDSISNSESYGQFSRDMEWFHCHKSTNVFAKSDIVSWRPLYFL